MALDNTANLEHGEFGHDDGGGEARRGAEVINGGGGWRGFQGGENLALGSGEGGGGRSFIIRRTGDRSLPRGHGADGDSGSRGEERALRAGGTERGGARWREMALQGLPDVAQGGEYVFHVFDQVGGPGLDEVVRAGGRGGIDAAGNGKNFAAVVRGGQAGGDERAGAVVGLHDQDAQRHPGDDAVARREVLGDGSGVEGEFGEDGAGGVGDDTVVEVLVFRRVGMQKSTSLDHNGAPLGVKGAKVGGGVDAAGAAGDDGQAGGGELGGEAGGLFAAVEGAVARADDAEGEGVFRVQVAAGVEDDGGIGEVFEGGGPFGMFGGEDADGVGFGEVELGLGDGGGGVGARVGGGAEEGLGAFGADVLDVGEA